MFAKAIEFDVKGKVVGPGGSVTNNSVYSKGEAWTTSKYFGFISSRINLGFKLNF